MGAPSPKPMAALWVVHEKIIIRLIAKTNIVMVLYLLKETIDLEIPI